MIDNPQVLADQFLTPALVLAAGLLVAVLGPAIEEVVKSLGVPLAGFARGRLRKSQAFAYGVMAGAGFSLVEAIFNGGALLPAAWASIVLVRAATVIIHGLSTGLLGLGWHALLVRRRWPAFGGWTAASLLVHGLWNGLSGLLTLAGLDPMVSGSLPSGAQVLPALVVSGLLLGLLLAAVLALVLLTGRLAEASRQAELPDPS